MVGLHALIGIGEGIITALTVGAVAAVRPDLVYLLRGRPHRLQLRGVESPGERGVTSQPSRSDAARPASCIGFLVVALVIAGGLSYLASGDPDGLDTRHPDGLRGHRDRAGEEQLTASASRRTRRTARSPAARSPTTASAVTSGLVGLAGIVGVLVTLLVAGGLFWLLRRRGDRCRRGER